MTEIGPISYLHVEPDFPSFPVSDDDAHPLPLARKRVHSLDLPRFLAAPRESQPHDRFVLGENETAELLEAVEQRQLVGTARIRAVFCHRAGVAEQHAARDFSPPILDEKPRERVPSGSEGKDPMKPTDPMDPTEPRG